MEKEKNIVCRRRWRRTYIVSRRRWRRNSGSESDKDEHGELQQQVSGWKIKMWRVEAWDQKEKQLGRICNLACDSL